MTILNRDQITALVEIARAECQTMFEDTDPDFTYYGSANCALVALQDWLDAHEAAYPVTAYSGGKTTNHKTAGDGIAAFFDSIGFRPEPQ